MTPLMSMTHSHCDSGGCLLLTDHSATESGRKILFVNTALKSNLVFTLNNSLKIILFNKVYKFLLAYISSFIYKNYLFWFYVHFSQAYVLDGRVHSRII